ncbi:MAG: MBL fold metallo-hydrolase [Candidatus Bathyarchaeota archaeon]|nr:MBL fold metallo-hydrolase [Candidatus Bathyarchaeota archaeon]
MHTKQISQNLFIVDLQTGGLQNLIASYVLKGDKTIIVETGPSSSIPNLLAGLEELEVRLEDVAYVALTHIHVDHGGGVGTLLKSLPNAKVVVHPKGAVHLKNPAKLWSASLEVLGEVAEMFGKPEPVPESRLVIAEENLELKVSNHVKMKVVEAPGHASHNLCYYEKNNGALFAGDSAGAYLPEFNTVFPTTPPPFHVDVALTTLDKLVRLNPEILCYSHFGFVFNAVEQLRDYQLQIRLWLSVAYEGVNKNQSLGEIKEAIFSRDPRIRSVVSQVRQNKVHQKTLLENSVQGFVDFARKNLANCPKLFKTVL